MKHTEIGRLGEEKAARFLQKNGYRLVARNLHQSHNEIDMIVKNKTYIVFVEVKSRTVDADLYSPYGTPASAVNKGKQLRTIEAARAILNTGNYSGLQPRFDVIEVYLEKSTYRVLHINHIVNAFGA